MFVEVSGLLKALASTLIKISGDLRLLSAPGPKPASARFACPPRQAGSSIMPGKVNPVIPEAVTQAALLAIGHDQALTMAVAMGSLELNPFLPLVAHCLLESFDLLARACDILAARLRRRHRGRRGAMPARRWRTRRRSATALRAAHRLRARERSWSRRRGASGRGLKDVGGRRRAA